VIALDQGTSATKAGLFRDGRLVREARRSVGLHFPAPGRAEQDARELARAAVSALEEVVGGLAGGETAVLGITNQRSTVVLWDAETGAPLGPALSWRDARASDEADALAAADPALEDRTGLPPSPHYGAPKVAWALEHWPEARRAADRHRLRVGPVGSWLLWKLTAGTSFAVDPTNAQRMHLLDLATLDWHAPLVEACGVAPSALPLVLPTDGHFGEARIAGRAVPVRAMLGDQQAALVGLRGDAAPAPVAGVHLGTGGFVLRDVGDDRHAVPGLLGGIARADANRPRRYLVEGPVNSAGSAFDRLRDLGLLGADESVDEACDRATRPLTVVPAWAGLAAPWWEAGARAALAGWDESANRCDVVAGTVRGVAFLVADVVDRMREHGVAVESLELSGPVSAVGTLGGAIASACGLTARVRTNPEASLQGIALLAAEAAGATPPALSIEQGAEHAPSEDLGPARRDFARLRDLVLERARGGRP
jgi:glycerol kinase